MLNNTNNLTYLKYTDAHRLKQLIHKIKVRYMSYVKLFSSENKEDNK